MDLIEETNKLITEKNEVDSLKLKETYGEIRSDIQTILDNQEISQKDIRLGFVWLATQSYELLKLNQELSNQLKKLVQIESVCQNVNL